MWDFGDGTKAGGAAATHTYTRAGTYTARVTVTDPRGASASSTVQVTVRNRAAGGVRGASESAPSVRVARTHRVATLVRRGLQYRVACAASCRVWSTLRMASGERRRLGRSSGRVIAAGRTGRVTVRLDRLVRRNLVAAMRQARVRRVRAQLVMRIRSQGQTTTLTRKVTLKR